MPRGAQVIYPKDLGPILILADVFPGARVLESGVGSGALTHGAAARGRPDRATSPATRSATTSPIAPARNVEGFLGPDLPLDIEVRDVYDGIDVDDLDRILLDLPEPWRVVKHAEQALHPGGILLVVPARRSARCRACARSSPTRRSAWSRRSRCCSAPGTSTASRCDPTTAWSPTPASSPTRGCSLRRPDAKRA